MPKFSCSLCPISAALVICVRCRLPNRRLLTTGCGALGLYGRTPERYTSFGLGAILARALALRYWLLLYKSSIQYNVPTLFVVVLFLQARCFRVRSITVLNTHDQFISGPYTSHR